ncbi:MAG: RluA family pseudouridine synthase [Lachnospiraceae bacterium]|nr:RluA family pseudouridine synthase [Lachnospiraceae bacterium]
MPVQTAGIGRMDMESELKNYLAKENGEPYLGVVHRLDQPVEGILVFAKTPKAMAALSSQLNAEDGMQKIYLARVYGHLPAESGSLTDRLVKDARSNLSHVAAPGEKGAKEAVLDYERLETDAETELLRIRLHTGRHHQIRVQLAHHGAPILGDRKYGTPQMLVCAEKAGINRLCLLARSLSFRHPVSGKRMEFSVECPF